MPEVDAPTKCACAGIKNEWQRFCCLVHSLDLLLIATTGDILPRAILNIRHSKRVLHTFEAKVGTTSASEKKGEKPNVCKGAENLMEDERLNPSPTDLEDAANPQRPTSLPLFAGSWPEEYLRSTARRFCCPSP